MSSFVYSTEESIYGPWLLGRDDLERLDAVRKEIFERFSGHNNAFVAKRLEEVLSAYDSERREALREEREAELRERYACKSTVRLRISKSKYVEDRSIAKLLALPELAEESPESIEIEVTTWERKAIMEIGANMYSRRMLTIRTSPERDESARDAFSSLRQWANFSLAPRWQQIWAKIIPFHWALWLLLVFILADSLPSESEQVRSALNQSAGELIEGGIDDNEVSKALELVLRYEIGIADGVATASTPLWFMLVLGVSFLIAIALSFCPGTVIGIGKNEQRLKHWRAWTRFLGITIPGTVITAFILPYILELLRSVL